MPRRDPSLRRADGRPLVLLATLAIAQATSDPAASNGTIPHPGPDPAHVRAAARFNLYDEVGFFHRKCDTSCPGLSAAVYRYAEYHARVRAQLAAVCSSPEALAAAGLVNHTAANATAGIPRAANGTAANGTAAPSSVHGMPWPPRLLLVGRMPVSDGLGHVVLLLPRLLLLAMASNRALFFDGSSLGGLALPEYFEGLGGIDWRFSREAEGSCWAALGLEERVRNIRTAGDAELAAGDEEAGWVTWKGMVKTFRKRDLAVPPQAGTVVVPVPENGAWAATWARYSTFKDCLNCELFAATRPRPGMRVWEWLKSSAGLGEAPPLACFRARTGYLDDRACFPDDTERTWEAMRARLRHVGCSMAWRKFGSHALVNLTRVVRRLRAVAASWGRGRVALFADAPALQEFLRDELGPAGFEVPGAPVHPICNPSKWSSCKAAHEADTWGAQADIDKLYADFYMQGFCAVVATPLPSMFYSSATERTALCNRACVRRALVPAGSYIGFDRRPAHVGGSGDTSDVGVFWERRPRRFSGERGERNGTAARRHESLRRLRASRL